MITLKKVMDQINIQCDIMPMGEDLTVLLYGGDLPHIGNCGIHVDGLSGDGIKAIYDSCLVLLDEVLAAIGNENLLLSSHK